MHSKRSLTLVAMVAVLTMSGCASVTLEETHSMRIETYTSEGKNVDGAECTVNNDYGEKTVESGKSFRVRRSNADLDISCKHEEYGKADGRAVSRANGNMLGNIIIGGGIGALIDHNNGKAYTYPTWVRLVFGKFLTFDRQHEEEGKPMLGNEIENAKKVAEKTQ